MRHEIMTRRTREEIDKLAAEMVATWKAAGSHQSNDDLRTRAMLMIFKCLNGAKESYVEDVLENA